MQVLLTPKVGLENQYPFRHSADPGSITNAMVHSTAVDTTPEALNRFNRQARGCVTESEFQLKYLPYPNARYSVSNCILSAKVESVVNSCQCWPPFFHGWQQKPLDRGDIKPCMVQYI